MDSDNKFWAIFVICFTLFLISVTVAITVDDMYTVKHVQPVMIQQQHYVWPARL